MRSTILTRRVGMTLVELLVVVAILGLLAVTVLPTLARSAEGRRTREAARAVSSFIAKSQSRAIGRTEWSGFYLSPPASLTAASFSLDLYLADVPEAYCGDSIPTFVSGTASGNIFTLTSGSFAGQTVTGSTGDLVRFDGQLPWYSVLSPTAVTLRNGNLSSENVSQTSATTAWPAAGAYHTFEVLRQPTRSGSPLTLADGRCVDLRWSGYGGSTLATYTMFGAAPGPIAVLFDGVGRVRQLFRNASHTRVAITGAVYLLIGRSDRAGQDFGTLSPADDSLGANWQYSDSYWVAIDPLSGVAKTAECAPNASDVFASQVFVRSEFLAGGR